MSRLAVLVAAGFALCVLVALALEAGVIVPALALMVAYFVGLVFGLVFGLPVDRESV